MFGVMPIIGPTYARSDRSSPSCWLPMVGAPGPKAYITMGGMFTTVKARENLTSYDDPGWYVDLPGTFTVPATLEQLNRDRIGL